MFVDTHSHLFLEDFDADREAVIARATAAGVTTFLNIGIEIESSKKAIALAEKYEQSFATVGIHPHEASQLSEIDRVAFEALYDHPKVIAIGEIGLDFFRNLCPQETQIKTFVYFLELYLCKKLPLIIHARDSFDAIIRLLKEVAQPPVTGLIHCFSGDETILRQVLDLGLYVSFAGQVSYKKSDGLRACARLAPSDRILIETDCPYLAPQSQRGRRNEPAFIRETAETIARERGMTLEDFGAITSQNAKALFRWDRKK